MTRMPVAMTRAKRLLVGVLASDVRFTCLTVAQIVRCRRLLDCATRESVSQEVDELARELERCPVWRFRVALLSFRVAPRAVRGVRVVASLWRVAWADFDHDGDLLSSSLRCAHDSHAA